MFWFREIISHAYEIWIWFHIPWNQSWFHIWNMDMISWFHIVWFHVLYMHAYMIGLTMISWVWFHTWNYDIIGNLKSYVLVSWNHIPCIWNLDMISYTMKSIMISYMKYGYDIMISYSVISCVIYACIYDRLDYDIMGMISYLKLWYHR